MGSESGLPSADPVIGRSYATIREGADAVDACGDDVAVGEKPALSCTDTVGVPVNVRSDRTDIFVTIDSLVNYGSLSVESRR
jgi:hypothetical protein